MLKEISVRVNGQDLHVQVEPRTLLIHMLRDTLKLTGSHIGCVVGRCGACTVLWKGVQVKSCMVFAVQTELRASVSWVLALKFSGCRVVTLKPLR